MSERSSFVSDALVYERPRQRQIAEALVEHLRCAVESAAVVELPNNVLMVAGYVCSGAPEMEWELLSTLPPFEHDLSLVINCDSGAVIRFNLKTGDCWTHRPT